MEGGHRAAPRAVFAGHDGHGRRPPIFLPGDRLATGERGRHRAHLGRPSCSRPSARRPLDARPEPTLGPARDDRRDAVVRAPDQRRDVTLRGHRTTCSRSSSRRDGSRVVTASKDGDARIWDARTGRSLKVLSGHGGTVFDASFSPDGRWVVTGGPATAGLWDAATARASGTSFGATGRPSARPRSSRRRGSSRAATTASAPTSAISAAASAIARTLAEQRLAAHRPRADAGRAARPTSARLAAALAARARSPSPSAR